MTMEMMEKVMELPLNGVESVRCVGAIQAKGLALCRLREERLRAEVDAALWVLKSWDWYDDDMVDVFDFFEDWWPHEVDEQDCQEVAEQISREVMGNYMSSRLSVDFAKLGWALDAYGDALADLRAAEWREANRLGLQVRHGTRCW